MLSASEIGTFAYCEEAWLLQRAGVVPDARGVRRLDEGTLAHRRIGRRIDGVRRADRARRLVLVVVFALVLVFALEGLAAHLVH
jgi:hypothetical protein